MSKFYMFILSTLFISNLSFASGIKGLSSEQIKDLDICLKERGFSFEEINTWKERYQWGADTKMALSHNKIYKEGFLSHFDRNEFDDSILVSLSIKLKTEHTFDDSIISNATISGNIEKQSFKNACIVNVKFVDASDEDIARITSEASFSKNISR